MSSHISKLIVRTIRKIKNEISNLMSHLTDSLRRTIDWLTWKYPKSFALLQRAIEAVVNFVQSDRYFTCKALIDLTIIFVIGSGMSH